MKLDGVDWERGNAGGISDMDITRRAQYQKRQRVCAIKFITLVNL